MWKLFEHHYAGAKRNEFERDLREKNHVIVLRDAAGVVQGFSTLLRIDDERSCVVFSGDTIVAPAHWGQTALQRAFIWYLMTQRLRRPDARVYWFLITKGYRTYLLISRYFPNHWPRHDAPMPREEAALLDALCTQRYGAAWDAKAGLLRYAGAGDSVRLSEALADVPARLRDDADVKFFLETNPRWAEGDELCCLARADDDFVASTTRIFL